MPLPAVRPAPRQPRPRALQAVTLTLALSLALALGACAGNGQGEAYVEQSVEQLYNNAVSAMEQEQFAVAASRFDEVERQHPYSEWATKSQLMAAYSLYMANKYDDSVFALDRYIQLHPSNKDVPYAYYLKGLNYYEQISDVGRDQLMTESALKAFNELVTRFPQSQYARDAKIKLELTYDHLAGKEMEIGRYYLTRKHYLAAINRFRNVVDNYQTTTHVPEALHRLVECNVAVGLIDEARKTAAVLGYNYPASSWYRETYALVGATATATLAPPAPSVAPAQPGQPAPPAPPAETTGDETPWYKFW